jgi:hypothetical protein
MIDANATTLAYTPYVEYSCEQATRDTQVVVRGAGISTIEYSLTPTQKELAPHYAKLKRIESDPSLWPAEAEGPSPDAVKWACLVLQQLESGALPPTRVVASAEGGVAICFVQGDKYSDIECLNSGTILGVLSDGRGRPTVWEIEPSPGAIAWAVDRIRFFLDSSPAAKDVSKWPRTGQWFSALRSPVP